MSTRQIEGRGRDVGSTTRQAPVVRGPSRDPVVSTSQSCISFVYYSLLFREGGEVSFDETRGLEGLKRSEDNSVVVNKDKVS